MHWLFKLELIIFNFNNVHKGQKSGNLREGFWKEHNQRWSQELVQIIWQNYLYSIQRTLCIHRTNPIIQEFEDYYDAETAVK